MRYLSVYLHHLHFPSWMSYNCQSVGLSHLWLYILLNIWLLILRVRNWCQVTSSCVQWASLPLPLIFSFFYFSLTHSFSTLLVQYTVLMCFINKLPLIILFDVQITQYLENMSSLYWTPCCSHKITIDKHFMTNWNSLGSLCVFCFMAEISIFCKIHSCVSWGKMFEGQIKDE